MYQNLAVIVISVVLLSGIIIIKGQPPYTRFQPPWNYEHKNWVLEYRPKNFFSPAAQQPINEKEYRSISYSRLPRRYNKKHFFGNTLTRFFAAKKPPPKFKYSFRQEDNPDLIGDPFGDLETVTQRDPPRISRTTRRPMTTIQNVAQNSVDFENEEDSSEFQDHSWEVEKLLPKPLSVRQKFIQIFMPILIGLMAWLGALMMMTSSRSSTHQSNGSGEMLMSGGKGGSGSDRQNIHIHMDEDEEDVVVVTKNEEEKEKDQKHEKLLKSLDVTDQVLSIVERGLLLAVRKVELLNVISGLTFPGGGSGGGGQGGGIQLQNELQKLTNLTSDAQNLLQGTLGLVSNNETGTNSTSASIEQILQSGLFPHVNANNDPSDLPDLSTLTSTNLPTLESTTTPETTSENSSHTITTTGTTTTTVVPLIVTSSTSLAPLITQAETTGPIEKTTEMSTTTQKSIEMKKARNFEPKSASVMKKIRGRNYRPSTRRIRIRRKYLQKILNWTLKNRHKLFKYRPNLKRF